MGYNFDTVALTAQFKSCFVKISKHSGWVMILTVVLKFTLSGPCCKIILPPRQCYKNYATYQEF